MSETFDRSVIRNLVREVISEVAGGGATPAAPATGTAPESSRVEEVAITSDADLARFVRHLLALSKNTEQWLAVAQGDTVFRLKGADPGPPATTVTPPAPAPEKTERIDKGLVSETRIAALAKDGVTRIVLGKSVVLTPLGRDKVRQLDVLVEREQR